MANTFIKATRIAAQALGLLEREIVLPALVWRDAGGDFKGAAGDTISIKVPARTTARRRTLRGARSASSEGTGIIEMDELTQTKVDVTLDEAIYNAIPVTDEELTLDIGTFGTDILLPQVRAVAEGLEEKVAEEMLGATYATTLTVDSTDPYFTLVDARAALNKANVPMSDRIVVLGADVETAFLKSEHLSKVDQSGSEGALRDAVIGRVAGFGTIYTSNALPPDVGFVFHRTAYVLSMQAPPVPDGASYGASQSYQGLAMRWLRDYDFRNVQDRSLVDVYAGTNIVADGPEQQVVTITGGPTGGTFTLTFDGQTTSAIAYNAEPAAVKAALEALSNINVGDVHVTGGPLPADPVTVTFQGRFYNTNVPAMTGSGAGLTGGTTPAVAVSAGPGGSGTSFVRAVKLEL